MPTGVWLTAQEVTKLCRASNRYRSVEHWLLVLASQLYPLVDQSSAENDCGWRKAHISDDQLHLNAEHLDALAAAGVGNRLKTFHRVQLSNQLEREHNLLSRKAQIAYQDRHEPLQQARML
jgi:hypothetical protein